MARGWESKSIESQQEDARAPRLKGRDLTAAERTRAAERATLELAIVCTAHELQAAYRPAHREMLRLRLDALKVALGRL
ncbi:MAG: hypothetical protein ACT4QD_16430 [Acidobacteriota bacterium]